MLPAQTRKAEQLRDNVVAIHTTFESGYEEDGFGFVTGGRDGLLFIATAAHVVEQGAERATIKLRFRGDYREYTVRLIRSNTEWDVALLECDRPGNYRWEEDYAGDAPQRNQQVSYIGRNGEWYVPTVAITGVINRVRDSRILVDIIGLSRGTSGAPLVNETGIIGLITEAETAQATAVALSRAKQLLTNYGEFPFLFQSSEAQQKIDEMNREVQRRQAAQAEDRAWQTAKNANTVTAYDRYLDEYPRGSYASEAKKRKNDLEETASRRAVANAFPKKGSVTLKGENYSTIQYSAGGLTWMTKNLNYELPDSWCYDNDPANCAEYGRLYTWEAAKKACQSLGNGWRLPTDQEWRDLAKRFGGADDDA